MTKTRNLNRRQRQARRHRESTGGRVSELVTATADDGRRAGVTIFADASFKDGCAGWGAWAKGGPDGKSVTGGGQMADLVDTSAEAEMRAIACAMTMAISAKLVSAGDAVMIQSDCLDALKWIIYRVPGSFDRPAPGGCTTKDNQPRYVLGPRCRASTGAAFVIDLAAAMNLTLITRHVRGHKAGDGRQWVNRTCDEIAKKHRVEREARRIYEARLGDGSCEQGIAAP